METSLVPAVEPTSNERGVLPQPILAKPRLNTHRPCRVCGSTRLLPYLNLGKQALANAYRDAGTAGIEARYPLALLACPQCKLSQLSYVVPRETLYADYAYRSGVSDGWRQHCAKLAEEYGRSGLLAVDIASNDGTLVRAFAARGCNAIGFEPSQSFANDPYEKRVAFWNSAVVGECYLKANSADIITAQNVLGHVDDVHDFMAGVKLALAPDGVCIVEVPYVCDMLDTLAFDTIYHEHLSYWSVTALKRLCEAHELTLVDVQHLAVHGGSIRAVIRHKSLKVYDTAFRVTKYLVDELHTLKRPAYEQFSARVTRRIAEINTELLAHTPYVGFGAPAKASVMLGCLDVRAYPYAVYDETFAKQGKLIPGTRVPIEALPEDLRDLPGPLCIFAWNWSHEISARLRAAGHTGAIFTPLPKPRWDYAQ